VVSLVNPPAIEADAGAQLSRPQTDCLEAELSARLCLTQQPQAWTPAAPQVRAREALVRSLDSLIEMYTMESQGLSSGVSTAGVRDSIKSVVNHLEEQIKRTQKLTRKQINKHPQLKADRDLRLSIPGLGEATSARLRSAINFHK
jgi:transposase